MPERLEKGTDSVCSQYWRHQKPAVLRIRSMSYDCAMMSQGEREGGEKGPDALCAVEVRIKYSPESVKREEGFKRRLGWSSKVDSCVFSRTELQEKV